MPLKSINSIDLIMLSNFDRSVGGRETWAYGFIPVFLGENPHLNLHIYGLTPNDVPHKGEELISNLSEDAKFRLKMTFFEVIWPKVPWFFSMLFQFRNHCKKSGCITPDMVLCVGGLSELMCMLFSRKYKTVKKILWMRTIFLNEKAEKIPSFLLPIGRWFEAKLLNKLDILLANGTDIVEHYARYGLNVHTVKNGVDLAKWNVGDLTVAGPTRIAFIGRLAPAKGIEEFLLAVEKIKARTNFADLEFIIAGQGPYSSRVKQMHEKGWLTYLGSVDNQQLPSHMANVDICVALTRAARFGGGGGTSNALLEQMAAGRVIVAWDNIIFRQILDEGTAYLCAQDNVDVLVECLMTITNDREGAKSKALKCKEIMKGFSNEAQVRKFETVIEGGIIE